MEIVLAALIAAAGLITAAVIFARRPGPPAPSAPQAAPAQLASQEGSSSADPPAPPVASVPTASVAQAPTSGVQAPSSGAQVPSSARTASGVGSDVSGRGRPVAPAGPPPTSVPPTPLREDPPRVSATTAQAAGRNGSPPTDRVDEIEAELRERRSELARMEERLLARDKALEARATEIERASRSAEDRARNLDHNAKRLDSAKGEQLRELERISGLSAGQARQIMMRELEDGLKHDRARLIRQVEESARRDADRRARSILASAMQRLAGGHAAETTVSVVQLRSDEMKGRIIGREGRNIRALETLTGIDFIIDDTPSAVVLSGFDGVRREVARLTLEKLLEDGRIHPASIEDAYGQAQGDMERRIPEIGEQAALDAGIGGLHEELTKLLGRLHYRTSYGQNVLAHSVECARLAAMIADELGAGAKTARRAALLHDIGKAVSHEVEGPHALVGGKLARRFGESDAVAHAMEAHHNEVQKRTVEAVVVQISDSLSGARPGARGESLESYVKRLHDLEGIATRHAGVEKVYAMQAGREVRVIVRPEVVDDDTATVLSHQIARDLERELEYAGQIKVTVIRESRAVDYAK